MATDKLILNVAGNPELRDYLADKAPGDECAFEVTAALDETPGDTATFSVTAAEVIDEGESDAEPEDAAEDGDMGEAMPGKSKGPPAVMMVFGKGKGGKGSDAG